MNHSCNPADSWPLVVDGDTSRDLVGLVRDWRSGLDDMLREHGAILFRGFGVLTPEAFRNVAEAFSPQLLEYVYRSTPRTAVEGRIYTASEYPNHAEIPMHNENSYQRDWPMKLIFACLRPADSGGETPLARTSGVTARIDPEVVAHFAERQVMYVRNYGPGVDLPWQTVFQTESKAAVEAYCASAHIDVEWTGDDTLRTRHVAQAVATHPQTGEQLWFNQAHLFHVSSLEPDTREAMLSVYAEDELPRHAFYGDGGSIPDAVLDHVRAACRDEMVIFGWQAGDVLLLDNMQALHGRQPYSGMRTVLTAMAEAHSVTAQRAAA